MRCVGQRLDWLLKLIIEFHMKLRGEQTCAWIVDRVSESFLLWLKVGGTKR
jgi:hypothetical protein